MKHIKSTSLAFALIVSTTTILAFQNCSKIAVNDLQPDLGVSGAGSPDIQVGDVPGGHIPQDGDDTGTGGNTGSGDNTGGAGGNTGSNDNPGGTGGNAGNNPGGNDGSDTDHNPGTGSGGDTGTGTGGNAGNNPGSGSGNTPGDVADDGDPSTQQPPVSGTPTPQPGTNQNDEIIVGVISRNSACNANVLHIDLRGTDYTQNGNFQNVAIKNVKVATINGGNGESISIRGAQRATIHGGNSEKICITAKTIDHISGNIGDAVTPVVLIGSTSDAILDGSSANTAADLVIKSLKVKGNLQASDKSTYLTGSRVDKLIGKGGDVYILNGSTVISTTGNFRNIYVSADSTILNPGGNFNIVPIP